MAEIKGFDWDPANVGHILRHAVTPFEVEEVAGRPHVTIPAKTVQGAHPALTKKVTPGDRPQSRRGPIGEEVVSQ